MAPRPLEEANLVAAYGPAKKRLFMFDYDGTLTPIVENPADAILSDEALRSIDVLASDPNNIVWVISGREKTFLDQHLGHLTHVGLCAEHGAFSRDPGSNDWQDLAASADMAWQEEVIKIFEEFTTQTVGSCIERKQIAVVWHYRRADPDFGALQAKFCQKLLEDGVVRRWPVEVSNGKCVVEVRPDFINKGRIVQRLVDLHKGETKEPPDFVLCFGDDLTDEDMFCALSASDLPPNTYFSIKVGDRNKSTDATWFLPDPTQVIATIAMLNGIDLLRDTKVDGLRSNEDSRRHILVIGASKLPLET